MSNLEALLLDQIKAAGLEQPVTEHKFHPKRRWRFDICWLEQKIAVEVEGGTWINGRHNRGAGFESDAEKYAEAMCLGWTVLRVTGSQICTKKAIGWIKQIIANPIDLDKSTDHNLIVGRKLGACSGITRFPGCAGTHTYTKGQDMLNATDVCAIFRISRLKLTSLLKQGKFPEPTSTVGMFKFWTPESIDGWTVPEKPAVKAKNPAAAKYRDGENTWAGRGKMANWLKAHIAAGRSIDEFKV